MRCVFTFDQWPITGELLGLWRDSCDTRIRGCLGYMPRSLPASQVQDPQPNSMVLKISGKIQHVGGGSIQPVQNGDLPVSVLCPGRYVRTGSAVLCHFPHGGCMGCRAILYGNFAFLNETRRGASPASEAHNDLTVGTWNLSFLPLPAA